MEALFDPASWSSHPQRIRVLVADDSGYIDDANLYVFPLAQMQDIADPPGEPRNLRISKSGANLVFTWESPSGTCNAGRYGLYRGDLTSGRPMIFGGSGISVTFSDFWVWNAPDAADTFDDGDASDWTFGKGSWNVVNQALVGTSPKKGEAASPFPSCLNCLTAAAIQANPGARISILPWFVDKKTSVEVAFIQNKGKIVLKHKSGGALVAKAAYKTDLAADTNYELLVAFDGASFHVFLDGAEIITEPTPIPPTPGQTLLRTKTLAGESVIIDHILQASTTP